MVLARQCTGIGCSPPRGDKVIRESRKPTFQQKCDVAQAFRSTDWTILYKSNSYEQYFTMFSAKINNILDFICPAVRKLTHSNDKPWLTDNFKSLVLQRQAAEARGDEDKYRALRNKVNSCGLHSAKPSMRQLFRVQPQTNGSKG